MEILPGQLDRRTACSGSPAALATRFRRLVESRCSSAKHISHHNLNPRERLAMARGAVAAGVAVTPSIELTVAQLARSFGAWRPTADQRPRRRAGRHARSPAAEHRVRRGATRRWVRALQVTGAPCWAHGLRRHSRNVVSSCKRPSR